MNAEIYITDKTGRKHFKTTCGYGFHEGELRNLQARLAIAKQGKVKSIDPATARLVMVVDAVEMENTITQADEELLNELFS